MQTDDARKPARSTGQLELALGVYMLGMLGLNAVGASEEIHALVPFAHGIYLVVRGISRLSSRH